MINELLLGYCVRNEVYTRIAHRLSNISNGNYIEKTTMAGSTLTYLSRAGRKYLSRTERKYLSRTYGNI